MLFLNNYLGNRYEELRSEILSLTERGEEDADVVREYQALSHFKRYLERVDSYKKGRFYKEMFRKAQEEGLTEEDMNAIRGATNG